MSGGMSIEKHQSGEPSARLVCTERSFVRNDVSQAVIAVISSKPVHDAKPLRVCDGLVADEPRDCPICKKPMTAVVRSVHCPCDAPWCFVTESRLACLECKREPT